MTQPLESASRAAAFGGATTFIDFTGGNSNTTDEGPSSDAIMKQIEQRSNAFTGHSYTDFAFHFTLAGDVPPPNVIGEIGEAIQAGVARFKIFTTFHGLRCTYGHIW